MLNRQMLRHHHHGSCRFRLRICPSTSGCTVSCLFGGAIRPDISRISDRGVDIASQNLDIAKVRLFVRIVDIDSVVITDNIDVFGFVERGIDVAALNRVAETINGNACQASCFCSCSSCALNRVTGTTDLYILDGKAFVCLI
jgi:hypothetical protein